ncbi:aldose epimerase family protein [Agrobacterium tumefaciens]|uniref:aldose epimerase family protein n=1 Tax=Agrobacterium tumefaciens TaxID=358 RepID=UPI003B9EB32F
MKVFSYGTLDGQDIQGFTISNSSGMAVTLMSYGARITKLLVPDREGNLADIVLGFETLDSYRTSEAYHGAICGRYGNRIGGATFVLDGEVHRLSRNDGVNHLHGGVEGFDRKNWVGAVDHEANTVVFRTVSGHGEEGFPGNLTVTVTYTLREDNILDVTYHAVTDQATVVSLINHSYWNLSGEGQGDITDHVLTLNSDHYIPTNSEVIPTGEIRATRQGKFDFTQPKEIGRDMSVPEEGKLGYRNDAANLGGYDATWVLSTDRTMKWAAKVVDPKSGRGFVLSTTEPSLQFYTAAYLDEPIPGKSGRPYGRYSGFTLEPQNFPDAPNVPHFPSATLRPGNIYLSKQSYAFFTQ